MKVGGFRPTKRAERCYGRARGLAKKKPGIERDARLGSLITQCKIAMIRLLVGRDDDFLSDEDIVGVLYAVPIRVIDFFPLIHRVVKTFSELA